MARVFSQWPWDWVTASSKDWFLGHPFEKAACPKRPGSMRNYPCVCCGLRSTQVAASCWGGSNLLRVVLSFQGKGLCAVHGKDYSPLKKHCLILFHIFDIRVCRSSFFHHMAVILIHQMVHTFLSSVWLCIRGGRDNNWKNQNWLKKWELGYHKVLLALPFANLTWILVPCDTQTDPGVSFMTHGVQFLLQWPVLKSLRLTEIEQNLI